MNFEVAIFAEGDYEESVMQPTVESARAFAEGVCVGAGFYGAGSIAAYVLPDDDARMREEQSAGAVARFDWLRTK